MHSGVHAHSLSRNYGKTKVLKGIDLNVRVGTIYGLLGPSGCGKTTLLKIILGRLEPTSGGVEVLGEPPNTKHHGIPGRRLGYSPQEMALYTDLTVFETLQFYGRLHGLVGQEFLDRVDWLLNFLEMDEFRKKLVAKLSGGQQRRVSLAGILQIDIITDRLTIPVALLHKPDVLILDEPTVGLDPLLRTKIWEHLRSITEFEGTTVVITTHYIEEARQADCVGLMREGKILAEGEPEDLMYRYQCDTLESVFLHLCRSQNDVDLRVTVQISSGGSNPMIHRTSSNQTIRSGGSTTLVSPSSTARNDHQTIDHVTYDEVDDRRPLLQYSGGKKKNGGKTSYWRQISAISRRKLKQYGRNPLMIIFDMVIPTIEILIYVLCVGTDPNHLTVAILNRDVGAPKSFGSQCENWGDQFVQRMNTGPQLNLYNVSDEMEGIRMVERGQAWASIVIPQNFSQYFPQRLIKRNDETVRNLSTVSIRSDLSNYEIGLSINAKIQTSFAETVDVCLNTTTSPLYFVDPPVYGSSSIKFSSFLAPGIISTAIFAHSIGLTAIAFIREKTDGTLDRVFAAGVSPTIFVLSHYLAQSITLVVQCCILLLTSKFILGIEIVGHFVHVLVILIILGSSGMALGLLVSAASKQETEAIQVTMAAFFPALLLSGVLWPIEAIPKWFSWVSLGLPTTWAADGLRSVMIRGWDIQHMPVYMAYIVPFAWAVALMLIAIFVQSRSGR
ncbi:hypothetical protein PROFUN_04452 [Planoprotostelium fungivorum]|uniref:Uncharacterized protein n=1 Tax=Planoprotostelium fungivorum TaxID=1890364 RepID=A0A2P6NVN2_9EUKA|nr:hypothetical protein PROFUN_04452 [Planoprotostelium fungivorum]